MTTGAILDVVDELRRLLEPGEQVEVDETGAEPLDWETAPGGRAYFYPARVAEVAFETGPTARQDFAVAAVFVAPSDEDARRSMDADLSALLDETLGRYLAAVRRNRSTTKWHHIAAAERPAPRTLTARAVALEITGYRFGG